jgi:hypothetical protein
MNEEILVFFDAPRIVEPIENEDERLLKVANDYCISQSNSVS